MGRRRYAPGWFIFVFSLCDEKSPLRSRKQAGHDTMTVEDLMHHSKRLCISPPRCPNTTPTHDSVQSNASDVRHGDINSGAADGGNSSSNGDIGACVGARMVVRARTRAPQSVFWWDLISFSDPLGLKVRCYYHSVRLLPYTIDQIAPSGPSAPSRWPAINPVRDCVRSISVELSWWGKL